MWFGKITRSASNHLLEEHDDVQPFSPDNNCIIVLQKIAAFVSIALNTSHYVSTKNKRKDFKNQTKRMRKFRFQSVFSSPFFSCLLLFGFFCFDLSTVLFLVVSVGLRKLIIMSNSKKNPHVHEPFKIKLRIFFFHFALFGLHKKATCRIFFRVTSSFSLSRNIWFVYYIP